MTQYEKLSLELLHSIATGTGLQLTQGLAATDEQLQQFGDKVQTWLEHLANLTKRVATAVREGGDAGPTK